MKNNRHEDLTVWQKGHQLTLDVFRTVNTVDPVLFEFMKESALRLVSKIAEGISRTTHNEQVSDLNDAKGAAARLTTQVVLSGKLNYITPECSDKLYEQTLEVTRMLSGLIRAIEKKNSTTSK